MGGNSDQWSKVLVPILTNRRPYNELMIRGHLKIGEHWVYTRSWNLTGISSPWPMLLYNSSRVDASVSKKYEKEFNSHRLPHGMIVAYSELVKWRELAEPEVIFLLRKFNQVTKPEAIKEFREAIPGRKSKHIWPCQFGLFFRKMVRLIDPIPFRIYMQKSFYRIHLSSIADQLEKSGVQVSEVADLLTHYK